MQQISNSKVSSLLCIETLTLELNFLTIILYLRAQKKWAIKMFLWNINTAVNTFRACFRVQGNLIFIKKFMSAIRIFERSWAAGEARSGSSWGRWSSDRINLSINFCLMYYRKNGVQRFNWTWEPLRNVLIRSPFYFTITKIPLYYKLRMLFRHKCWTTCSFLKISSHLYIWLS